MNWGISQRNLRYGHFIMLVAKIISRITCVSYVLEHLGVTFFQLNVFVFFSPCYIKRWHMFSCLHVGPIQHHCSLKCRTNVIKLFTNIITSVFIFLIFINNTNKKAVKTSEVEEIIVTNTTNLKFHAVKHIQHRGKERVEPHVLMAWRGNISFFFTRFVFECYPPVCFFFILFGVPHLLYWVTGGNFLSNTIHLLSSCVWLL